MFTKTEHTKSQRNGEVLFGGSEENYEALLKILWLEYYPRVIFF